MRRTRRSPMLVSSAEGWPAGLQLLALAVADSGQHSPSPASGRDRLIFDYFDREVLAPLPDEYVTFLERSSVLDVLTGPMLDELLEMDGAADDLARPRRDDRLLPRAPGPRTRVLPLCTRCSRRRSAARLEQFDPSRADALHLRASTIFERLGDLDGAVRHAIAADDIERAADLALVGATPLVFAGCIEPLGQWLDLLGEDAMRRWPSAAIAWAWYGLASGGRRADPSSHDRGGADGLRRASRRRITFGRGRRGDGEGDDGCRRRAGGPPGHGDRPRRRRAALESLVGTRHARTGNCPFDGRRQRTGP